MSKIINEIINGMEFTPDCQNKWDFDGAILKISSRGYDRNSKSFYVGYLLVLKQSEEYGIEKWVEILKDELFDEDFASLKNKVKQWYKANIILAFEIAIKVLKGEYKIEKDGFVYKIIDMR